MDRKTVWIALIAMLAGLLVWLAFFWTPNGALSLAQNKVHTQLQQDEAPKGGDFTLQSPAGPVSLADQRGKVVLLYFGYTFCPDICPTSLSAIAQALSALTPAEMAKVKTFFISVDPERDTMDVLKVYAPFFHPSIVGLSGSSEQVAQVARLYGARYMKQKPDENGLYSVDHSAYIYVVAPDGKLAASLPHGTLPTQIVDMIRSQLKP
ncbi:MAG: electron transport protein SCO1/SenC [Proteobacteria bacterium]|nr:electron transport protein SCO1/SenC [Pseudomonadota bacterium]